MPLGPFDPDPGGATGPDEAVAFGDFALERGARSLWRGNVEIELPERSLRLLELLVRSAGRTVSRDELIEQVWQGAFVADASLSEAVSRLRHALGDSAREPRYVRTVHRRGYRFVAAVGARRSSGRARRRTPWLRALVAAALVAAVGFWVALGGSATGRAGVPPTPSDGAVTTRLDPLQGLRGLLPRFAPSPPPPELRRYRLAEVSADRARPTAYSLPALPLNDLAVDGRHGRVAFSVTVDEGQSDMWVAAERGGMLERIASGGVYSDPVWTADGRALAMAHERGGDFDLILQETDGTRRVLLTAPLDQFPESWSRDGKALVYSERHPDTGFDLWLLKRRSGRWVRTPLVRTPHNEAFGAISPDGRYVAYVATREERPEIFVLELASDGSPLQVSRDGGGYPFWSPTGDRLHYVHDDTVWATATDRLDSGPLPPPAPASAAVDGLHLAGVTASADRFVVALRD